ncbi:uncharacterized protein LOC113296456 [Papaver somniferum]|uniref:uncharacterized protein LOC113296456 n=1 Tax=Papaver somniferum TaxID=3469 RepID=UPI000E6FF4D9|nr:uncharacterized protein LOC113296456 [Papaver somniferum]
MRKQPKKKRQFKVELHWTKHPQFLEVAKKSWEESTGDTIRKLSVLQKSLNKWSRATFGNIEKELEVEKQKLVDIKSKAHMFDVREEERITQEKIKNLMERERMYWKHRSKSYWVPNNDKNTRVFHLSVLHRRSKNLIIALKNEEGNWTSEPEAIKTMLISHFQNVFSKDVSVSANSCRLRNEASLSSEEGRSLSRIPTAEEIFNVLKKMGSLRSWFRWVSRVVL